MARSDVRVNGEGNAASEKNMPAANPEDYKAFTQGNIEKIMQRALPADMKVSEDAKEMMQVNVTEFIKLVTNEANAMCHSECRNTITVENMLSALVVLGFDHYVQPLCHFMNKYQEQDPDRHGSRDDVYAPPRMIPPVYYADRDQVPPRVEGGKSSSGGPSAQFKQRE